MLQLPLPRRRRSCFNWLNDKFPPRSVRDLTFVLAAPCACLDWLNGEPPLRPGTIFKTIGLLPFLFAA